MTTTKKQLFSKSIVSLIAISTLGLSGCSYLSDKEHKTDPHWGYSGNEGPENWGKLADNFTLCEKGVNQSPINITNSIEANLPTLLLRYGQAASNIENNGHTVQINFPADSGFMLDKTKYELKQVHFHSPSENTIEGNSYPLEAHFVHADPLGQLAVVAVMFKEGSKNDALANALQQLPTKKGDKHLLNNKIYPREMMPKDMSYYHFSGSLTTPPCSEGVLWLVLKQPITASNAQIKAFESTFGHANNRPVQPVNHRPVLK